MRLKIKMIVKLIIIIMSLKSIVRYIFGFVNIIDGEMKMSITIEDISIKIHKLFLYF